MTAYTELFDPAFHRMFTAVHLQPILVAIIYIFSILKKWLKNHQDVLLYTKNSKNQIEK